MDKKEAEAIIKEACALLVANLASHQRVQEALTIIFTPETTIAEIPDTVV